MLIGTVILTHNLLQLGIEPFIIHILYLVKKTLFFIQTICKLFKNYSTDNNINIQTIFKFHHYGRWLSHIIIAFISFINITVLVFICILLSFLFHNSILYICSIIERLCLNYSVINTFRCFIHTHLNAV